MSWRDYDFGETETDYYAGRVDLEKAERANPGSTGHLRSEEVWTGGPDGAFVKFVDVPLEPDPEKPPVPKPIPGQIRLDGTVVS